MTSLSKCSRSGRSLLLSLCGLRGGRSEIVLALRAVHEPTHLQPNKRLTAAFPDMSVGGGALRCIFLWDMAGERAQGSVDGPSIIRVFDTHSLRMLSQTHRSDVLSICKGALGSSGFLTAWGEASVSPCSDNFELDRPNTSQPTGPTARA